MSEEECNFKAPTRRHSPLGCVSFYNESDLKTEDEDFETTLKNMTAKLPKGNESHKIVLDEYLLAEYPTIATGEQDKVIFMPETFLTSYPECVDSKKVDEKVKHRWDGEQTEKILFKKLQNFFHGNCNEKKTVVLHSFKDHFLEKLEFDFLVINEDTKMVIMIECKTNGSKKNLERAANQLHIRFQYFKKHMPFGKEWVFIKSFFARKINEESKICEKCQQYTLFENSDIQKWWENCINSAFNLHEKENPLEKMKLEDKTYIRLIQVLLYLSRCSLPIHTRHGEWAKLFEDMKKLETVENRVLWSSEQYKPFYESHKKVFFTSRFGTGKTLLLKSKCIQLAKTYPEMNCYYIVMPAILKSCDFGQKMHEIPNLRTLIELSAESMFKGAPNAIAQTWKEILDEVGKENAKPSTVYSALTCFIELKCVNSSFFIDEFHKGYWQKPRAPSSSLQGLAKLAKNHLWIANNADFTSPEMEASIKRIFEVPELNQNMRNVKSIVSSANDPEPDWDNYPEGPEPFDIIWNKNDKTIETILEEAFTHLQGKLEGLMIIVPSGKSERNQCYEFCQNYVSKMKKEKGLHDKNLPTICLYGTTDDSKAVTKPKNLSHSLKKEIVGNKALVITSMMYAQGAESKSVIAFLPTNGMSVSKQNERVYVTEKNMRLRAVVKLITVKQQA